MASRAPRPNWGRGVPAEPRSWPEPAARTGGGGDLEFGGIWGSFGGFGKILGGVWGFQGVLEGDFREIEILYSLTGILYGLIGTLYGFIGILCSLIWILHGFMGFLGHFN